MSQKRAGKSSYVQGRLALLTCSCLGTFTLGGFYGIAVEMVSNSGLGPKEHLQEKGVSVIADLPAVGSHLVSGSNN